ncbi:MAG: 2-oxoacid:acceptor oxidoreductase subunit alpha [Dehalococcoidales bacterium]|nr:2-oxoacid:acceptor oxidoreductase subunit alpha [Dehalococcoidales bacterium]
MDFNFMIGGEAGQGIQSVGLILAKSMMRGGYNVFFDQDYESRIRGGHSFSRVRVADREIRAMSEAVDILIALNRETIDIHRSEARSGNSVIIYDQEKMGKDVENKAMLLNIPFERLAVETTSNKVMANTVAAAAALGLVEYDFDKLTAMLRAEFGHHGEKVVEDNVKAARAGYDYAREHRLPTFTQRVTPIGESRKMLVTGNEAAAFGALAAGCKFVSGYPMTPTTSILEYIALRGQKYNVKVVQAEDEISAMNMVVGAGYAGVRAMTATSGGGFCLMTEGLSLAGMTETPVVVVLGMRPGPAIGLPTRSEQGELLFALHAGHGEFPRAVLAPACAEDAFWLMIKAFNLAEKYQMPVIMLTDHELADSYSTIDRFDLKQVKIDRGHLILNGETDGGYKRYAYTESGISPRAMPGQGKALVVADSDEHNEEGHIIEDGETRRRMMLKRLGKMNGMKTEISLPRTVKKANARANLVGWGSTWGAIIEAQDILEKEGLPVNVMHLNQIWPFPGQQVASLLRDSIPGVVIENNATGQLARLIRTETGIKTANILKFDGRAFSPRYIVNELKKEVRL